MSKDVNNISNRASVNKALAGVDLKYKQDKIAFAVAVNRLNTGRIKNEEEMETRIQQLFDLCQQTGNIPSYESLAVACGIPISTFYDMKQGNFEGYKQYSEIIKRAKDTISLMENNLAADGTMPSAVWIFRAKNYQKMKDVQQVEVAPTSESDKPNDSNDLLNTLPEAPDKDTVNVDSKETASSEEK